MESLHSPVPVDVVEATCSGWATGGHQFGRNQHDGTPAALSVGDSHHGHLGQPARLILGHDEHRPCLLDECLKPRGCRVGDRLARSTLFAIQDGPQAVQEQHSRPDDDGQNHQGEAPAPEGGRSRDGRERRAVPLPVLHV